VIEVENLSKRYGDRAAVRNVSFRVDRGEIVGFLGPNGAGKSTTLRILTGFLAPSEGSVKIDGVDARSEPVEARRRIGYMPEATPVYPEMRVHEYLRYRAELKGVGRKAIKGRIDAALEMAKVADMRTRIIGQLSKGYRQRLGLADALIADPPLLVLDEPTAGLDPNQIREVRALVRSFAGTKTVLLSTHILPEVEATCTRVLIIHQGKLVGEGRPDELRSRAAQGAGQFVVLEGRGSMSQFDEAVRSVPAVQRVAHAEHEDGIVRMRIETEPRAEVAEDVFRAVAKAGLALRELRREAASLEDVFAHLTTADQVAVAAVEPEASGKADSGTGSGTTEEAKT